jgi:hypothetical protein
MKFHYSKEELASAYERVRKLSKEDIDAIDIVLLHSLRIGNLVGVVGDLNSAIRRWDFMQMVEEKAYPSVVSHDSESDFIDAVEKAVIQVNKEDTKDSVHDVPPILPRRSGRYPWGQSTNIEYSIKEDKKDE